MTDFSYIALDPGETTGWAGFDDKGVIQKYGQFTQAEQNDWLNEHVTPHCKMMIIEDYKNYAHKKQKNWSRNQTSKNIGAIEMICELRGVPYFLQPANVKGIGYRFAGMDGPPSDHRISHQYDAVAHGTYWLRVNGILIPTSLD